MKRKKNAHPYEERVVRIIDDSNHFRGTGTLLDNHGWVLTCGHVFKSLKIGDGVSLNKNLAWTIQTIDGVYHAFEYLEEKFDDRCLFDYALIKTKCTRSFSSPLITRGNVEEHRSAHMFGFSGQLPFKFRVDGRIIGPLHSYEYGCTHPALQLLWENPGSFTGFSGAPILVTESQVGTLLAGIQSSELGNLHAQVGTPLAAIQQRSLVFSTTIETLSDADYRRAGFRHESVRDLRTPTSAQFDSTADCMLERMRQSVPKLIGQISARKLANRMRQRASAGDRIVALVVSARRPNKVLARDHLATHFRRQRWRQNMFEVMTEEELRQLRSYREYVEVFLI